MSATTKHTPGPWWAHKNPHTGGPFSHFITDDPNPSEDGEFAEVASVVFTNDAEANARLIAAAPALLDFVRLVADLEAKCRSEGGRHPTYAEWAVLATNIPAIVGGAR